MVKYKGEDINLRTLSVWKCVMKDVGGNILSNLLCFFAVSLVIGIMIMLMYVVVQMASFILSSFFDLSLEIDEIVGALLIGFISIFLASVFIDFCIKQIRYLIRLFKYYRGV